MGERAFKDPSPGLGIAKTGDWGREKAWCLLLHTPDWGRNPDWPRACDNPLSKVPYIIILVVAGPAAVVLTFCAVIVWRVSLREEAKVIKRLSRGSCKYCSIK